MNEVAQRFRRKRLLTRPVLKFDLDVPRYVKIEAPMFIGKDMPLKPGAKPKEPATLCHVIDLETGDEVQIVLNAVVKSTLMDEFPDDGYVGKCFAITRHAKDAGKEYFKFGVEEIEDPASEKSAPVAEGSESPTMASKHRKAG